MCSNLCNCILHHFVTELVVLLLGCGSGADRATNLRRPEKSIPQGTLGAIVVSFVMYISYMGLWAAVAQRDYLLGNIGSGDKHAMLEVVREVAYPLAILTELGICITAIAQAMQCIIISPRLLQVIFLLYP